MVLRHTSPPVHDTLLVQGCVQTPPEHTNGAVQSAARAHDPQLPVRQACPTAHWLLAEQGPQVPSARHPWPAAHWLAIVHSAHTPATQAFPPLQSPFAPHTTQMLPRQTPDSQSPAVPHDLPLEQVGHGPPQSTSGSAGALMPSVQLSSTHRPRLQWRPEAHVTPTHAGSTHAPAWQTNPAAHV
jgi:hypothetical protein